MPQNTVRTTQQNEGGGAEGGQTLSDVEREVLEGGRKAVASIQVTQQSHD